MAEKIESGIYYLTGDAIPVQLIIVPALSKNNNYWLNNLRNESEGRRRDQEFHRTLR